MSSELRLASSRRNSSTRARGSTPRCASPGSCTPAIAALLSHQLPPPPRLDRSSWQVFPNGNVSRPARETDNERVEREIVVLRRELTRMLLATPRATASPVHVHRPAFNVARSDSNRQTRGARQAEKVRARSYRSSGARERRGKATVAPRAAEAGESKSSSMDGWMDAWTGRWFDSIRSSPSQSPWTQRVSNSRPFVRFPSLLTPLPHRNDNAF